MLPGPSIKFGAKVTREDFRLSEDPATNVENKLDFRERAKMEIHLNLYYMCCEVSACISILLRYDG